MNFYHDRINQLLKQLSEWCMYSCDNNTVALTEVQSMEEVGVVIKFCWSFFSTIAFVQTVTSAVYHSWFFCNIFKVSGQKLFVAFPVLCNASQQIGMLWRTTHLRANFGRSLPFLWQETVEQLFKFAVTHGFLIMLPRLFSRQVWLLSLSPFVLPVFITTMSCKIFEYPSITDRRKKFKDNVAHNTSKQILPVLLNTCLPM